MINWDFDPFAFGDPVDGDPSDLDALLEDLGAQAAELWRHLPAGEVGDDESLVFRTDPEGRLMVGVPATGVAYGLRDGLGWRARNVVGGSYEVTIWDCGVLCDLHMGPLEELTAAWN